jgi:Protein of unknown function (DUF3307)
MEQLILHTLGDHLIQNDWMAQNKKVLNWKGELACQVHCVTYSLPFLFIGSWWAVLAIYLTHYAIDRSNFVVRYMRVMGKSNFIKAPFAPWGIFTVDNAFHLICNYLALTFL